MIDINQREAVMIGALLHDIGKFVQRAQGDPKSQNHSQWGEEWFQENLSEKLSAVFNDSEKQIIRSAISNHHFGEKYISLADAISSGMDRIELEEEEKGDPFTDRLISIFSRISISDKTKKEKYHKLLPLGKENLKETFPINDKKCSFEEYSALLEDFQSEVKSIDFNDSPGQNIINALYFLLWKYAWCIPSAAYKDEPDVSLFDHLKTTAAIAGCMYAYHKENPEEQLSLDSNAFCLISGDISGIQNYIFDVLTQQGKVAKRLRARSLLVQIISEIAAHQILHELHLPLCNIVSSAGGNFYILLPNIKNIDKKLEEFQYIFDKFTYENFKGEIFLTLSWITTNGKNLGKFDELLSDLKLISQTKKYKPYHLFLVSDKQWQRDNFLLDEVIQGDERACNGCHRHPIVDEKEKSCEYCMIDIKIGTNLPKAKYIAFFRDNKHDYHVLNYSFEIWDKILKNHSAYLILALNTAEQSGIGFKFITNHIPLAVDVDCTLSEHQHESNPLAFFDCIANASHGDTLLGYIKADVDDMGKVIKFGFDSEKPTAKYKITEIKPSISRFCSFSRMLETFFAGYLQTKLESDFKDIYTVFSGGDDFFVIGPWNKAIDFTYLIRKEFTDFCAENPDLNFSSGIILSKPYEPLSYCTKMVEDKLKDSKRLKGKDRITLFSHTVTWNELNKILAEAKRVIEWVEKKPPVISRSFAYNLWRYGEMNQRYKEKNETKWLKFVPLLICDINRNLTRKEQADAYDWALNLSPTVKKEIGEDNMPYLRTIMEYVLAYTRS